MSFKGLWEKELQNSAKRERPGSAIKSKDQAVPLESHPALRVVSAQVNRSSDIQNSCIKRSFHHIYPLGEGDWIKRHQDMEITRITMKYPF